MAVLPRRRLALYFFPFLQMKIASKPSFFSRAASNIKLEKKEREKKKKKNHGKSTKRENDFDEFARRYSLVRRVNFVVVVVASKPSSKTVYRSFCRFVALLLPASHANVVFRYRRRRRVVVNTISTEYTLYDCTATAATI